MTFRPSHRRTSDAGHEARDHRVADDQRKADRDVAAALARITAA